MTQQNKRSRLIDPRYCIEQAQQLTIPITKENWDRVSDDADDLNVLQAAITHLVYADAEREHFQEQVAQIVFTAYLMGRAMGEEVRAGKMGAVPYEFVELIESLDLSGLTG